MPLQGGQGRGMRGVHPRLRRADGLGEDGPRGASRARRAYGQDGRTGPVRTHEPLGPSRMVRRLRRVLSSAA